MSLILLTLMLVFIERAGRLSTPKLSFKADIKAESQWLAQYGQFVCTAAACGLVLVLEPVDPWLKAAAVALCVSAASVSALVGKRLFGRVRPSRQDRAPGRAFLGPSLKHASWRESMPSSHTACAVALTVVLLQFYPQAWPVLWTLAAITGALRWLLDAHWLSDITAGAAVGVLASGGMFELLTILSQG